MNIKYDENLKEGMIDISFWNNLLSHECEVNMQMRTSMTTPLWGFSVPQRNKQLKQAQQVKNSNREGADQLTVYKHSWQVNLTKNYPIQIQLVVRLVPELRMTRFHIQCPNHLAKLPPRREGKERIWPFSHFLVDTCQISEHVQLTSPDNPKSVPAQVV